QTGEKMRQRILTVPLVRLKGVICAQRLHAKLAGAEEYREHEERTTCYCRSDCSASASRRIWMLRFVRARRSRCDTHNIVTLARHHNATVGYTDRIGRGAQTCTTVLCREKSAPPTS